MSEKKKLSSYQKLKKKIRKQKKKLQKKENHIYLLLMKPDSPKALRLRMMYELKFNLSDAMWQGDPTRDFEIQETQGIFPLMKKAVEAKVFTKDEVIDLITKYILDNLDPNTHGKRANVEEWAKDNL